MSDAQANVAGVQIPVGWSWWAGSNEEEFRLAGPCRTREEAISEAYAEVEPGDWIFVIEALPGDDLDEETGLYPFEETRNASSVLRGQDR